MNATKLKCVNDPCWAACVLQPQSSFSQERWSTQAERNSDKGHHFPQSHLLQKEAFTLKSFPHLVTWCLQITWVGRNGNAPSFQNGRRHFRAILSFSYNQINYTGLKECRSFAETQPKDLTLLEQPTVQINPFFMFCFRTLVKIKHGEEWFNSSWTKMSHSFKDFFSLSHLKRKKKVDLQIHIKKHCAGETGCDPVNFWSARAGSAGSW